uniref:Uncharacterized protein n=1 Tax=Anguilla anguilla TaxID=7936 RepID=A0A0E9SQI6_ANGAN
MQYTLKMLKAYKTYMEMLLIIITSGK